MLVAYEPYSELLKGDYIGDYMGTTTGVMKGATRSLDYSSYVFRRYGVNSPFPDLAIPGA